MTVEYIIKAAVQVIFLTFCFYKFYIALETSKAGHVLGIVVGYALAYVLAAIFKLGVVETLMQRFFLPAVIFVCVLYQPELRRAFGSGAARNRILMRRGVKTSAESIDAILGACSLLVRAKRGALIVFPRTINIKATIETGTRVNAEISTAIVGTVFDHDTPLHDGAMIVSGDRIVACGCYLPLSSQTDISATFGTRHRAALGLAEESDAVVLVVSEESGAMSLAYNGNLYYDLDTDTCKKTIMSLLSDMEAQSSVEA